MIHFFDKIISTMHAKIPRPTCWSVKPVTGTLPLARHCILLASVFGPVAMVSMKTALFHF